MKKQSYSLVLLTLVLAFCASTYAQKGSEKGSACALPGLPFQCPKGLKVLKHDVSKKMFLAQRIEEDYTFSVFVVDKNSTRSIEETIEKEFLPLLFPKSKAGFKWRDMEFLNDKPVSKFEVRKKLFAGFNDQIMVDAVYREVVFRDKAFFIGSVWREESTVEEAAELFEEATGMVEGSGCDHIVKIVRAITKEKVSAKDDPCSYELIGTPVIDKL